MSAPRRGPARSAFGFTLLEVIVIIIVGGLLAALVVNLMGTQLLRSSRPASLASDAAEAEAAMEAVVADYTNRMNDGATYADLSPMVAAYAANGTVGIVDDTAALWNSVPALIVTTTVGGTSYTTLLTQARTNVADNATDF
jgi:Tfp pilus assembly protein PilE